MTAGTSEESVVMEVTCPEHTVQGLVVIYAIRRFVDGGCDPGNVLRHRLHCGRTCHR